MKPLNKIEAIKMLRSLPIKIETKVVNTGYGYDYQAQIVSVDLGLKEAKDFVEAIMELNNNPEIATLKADLVSMKEAADQWKKDYYELRQRVSNSLFDYTKDQNYS